MHVTGLAVHPVKSLRGTALETADVEPQGLRHDRRWMLVDEAGERVRLDRNPQMLAVTALPRDDGGIELTAAGRPSLVVAPPDAGQEVPVSMARVDRVRQGPAAAHDWLSEAVGRTVRLVWLDDPRRRTVSASHGGRPGDVLSLADTGPLLLTSMVSLRRLEDWAVQRYAERYAVCGRAAGGRPRPIAMERFRPNVVLDGNLEPFAEDDWVEVQVGEVRFRVSEPCDRCPVPGIDPATQQVTGEPLRTLARHRRRDGRTWFGIRLVPVTTGAVRVGDPVVARPREPQEDVPVAFGS